MPTDAKKPMVEWIDELKGRARTQLNER